MVRLGDCLDLLPEYSDGSVDLIYLDPPFNTGQAWRGAAGSFQDMWETMDDYIAWMRPRVEELHRALKRTGSLYLHCDDRASAYLRLLLDSIFGPERLLSVICWKRTMGAKSNISRRFGRSHDTIFFYSKSARKTWNPPRRDAASLEREGNWEATDVWLDIGLAANSKERSGYPTQKPVALLERIIRMSSNSGDLVLDPMCGSGTTLVAARNLGRRFLGFDLSPDAVDVSERRLAA